MTIPLDPTLLSRLKALHEKATPGDWQHVTKDDPRGQPVPYYRALICLMSSDPYEAIVAVYADTVEQEEWAANADLIAALRNAWPQLLAHIEAQDKRLSAVSGLVEALERLQSLCHGGSNKTSEGHAIACIEAGRALAAWRKNHEL